MFRSARWTSGVKATSIAPIENILTMILKIPQCHCEIPVHASIASSANVVRPFVSQLTINYTI